MFFFYSTGHLSSFTTVDPFISFLNHEGHTGGIFHTLTSQTVPGEVEEIFGAGDGDHLADLGTGPAGDLVPHPTASWAEPQRERERHREAEAGFLLDTQFKETASKKKKSIRFFLVITCFFLNYVLAALFLHFSESCLNREKLCGMTADRTGWFVTGGGSTWQSWCFTLNCVGKKSTLSGHFLKDKESNIVIRESGHSSTHRSLLLMTWNTSGSVSP